MIFAEEDLGKWHHQWANYQVLLSMAELGFFDLLADGEPRSAATIADALGADSRAIDICGRILTRAGLLLYEEDQFRLAQVAHELREPIQELKGEWRRRENYANLIETIRSGQPALLTSGGVLPDDEAETREFLRKLHRHSAVAVRETLKVIPQTLVEIQRTAAPRILDLGGGHGRFAAAFAAEIAGAQVTMFDRELATRIAHELSGTRFQTLAGDFLCDNLGGLYDVVFMANVVSGISDEDNRHLLSRVRQAIEPGGALVVLDLFIEENRLEPASAIDFNLVFLLENASGRFRTAAEVKQMLSDAGFTSQRHLRLTDHQFGFMIGI